MIRLRSQEFRREREGTWSELERLLARLEQGGVKGLRAQELERLPRLYRATLSSLSVARAISTDRNLLDYLESLAARAYVHVYATRRGLLETCLEFFASTFPSMVRRHAAPIGLAGLFLLLGIAAGAALVSRDMDRYHAFVPDGMAGGRTPEASTEYLRSTLYAGDEQESEQLGAFAAMLFAHNARIGMLCFALGILAGVPVILLLLYTGTMLGAFAALFASRGLGMELWGWLLPHGVTELLAVVLCGGAGLVLARGLVFPGVRRRRVELALRGREASLIVIGAVAMLLLAGLVEGIFRQRVQNDVVRYVVALASAAAWTAYFGLAGRTS
jgi:uncharacterized membrane protein SpoIIM required for sporulation